MLFCFLKSVKVLEVNQFYECYFLMVGKSLPSKLFKLFSKVFKLNDRHIAINVSLFGNINWKNTSLNKTFIYDLDFGLLITILFWRR